MTPDEYEDLANAVRLASHASDHATSEGTSLALKRIQITNRQTVTNKRIQAPLRSTDTRQTRFVGTTQSVIVQGASSTPNTCDVSSVEWLEPTAELRSGCCRILKGVSFDPARLAPPPPLGGSIPEWTVV